MQQQEERWRDRLRGAPASYFAKRSFPRQTLALLILDGRATLRWDGNIILLRMQQIE